jgi:hypothetical protein
MVMMQPPGSFPGINSFAMAPMTRPITKTQTIECALKSIWEAILIREPKLVNLTVLMVGGRSLSRADRPQREKALTNF